MRTLALIALLLLSGCVRIKTPDWEYIRFGDQKIGTLEIENTTLGKIKIVGQESKGSIPVELTVGGVRLRGSVTEVGE
jgi:hypothetical protein